MTSNSSSFLFVRGICGNCPYIVLTKGLLKAHVEPIIVYKYLGITSELIMKKWKCLLVAADVQYTTSNRLDRNSKHGAFPFLNDHHLNSLHCFVLKVCKRSG